MKEQLPCLYCGSRVAVGNRSCSDCSRAMILRIADRFDLLKCLSWGETVYALVAWDRQENREVFIRAALNTASPGTVNSLNAEAQVLLGLKGDSGIPAFVQGGMIRQTGGLYIAEEFVKGVALNKAWSGLPANKRLELIVHSVTAVNGLHNQGLVHCSIDPAQFMVCDDGRLVLTDFRQTRQAGDKAGTSPTNSFLAPEQFTPTNVVTPATDVYALGGCAYFSLTGKTPFGGKKALSPRRPSPPKPSEVCSGITDDLDAVVLRALAFDPANRFQSALELFEAIRTARGHDTVVDSLPYTYPSAMQRVLARLKEICRVIATCATAAVNGVCAYGRAMSRATGLSASAVYAGTASALLAASGLTALLCAMPAPIVRWPISHQQMPTQNRADMPAIPLVHDGDTPSIPVEMEVSLEAPTIQVLTWPPSEVYLDGRRITEAPSPNTAVITAGQHRIKLMARTGQKRVVTFNARVGTSYVLKYNFETGKLDLEERVR